MLGRLVDLKVLEDPDKVKYNNDNKIEDSSSDYEHDWETEYFDFVGRGKERVGRLFVGKANSDKRKKGQEITSVDDLLRRNDFIMINKTMQKAVEHEEFLKKLDNINIQEPDTQKYPRKKGIFAFIEKIKEDLERIDQN